MVAAMQAARFADPALTSVALAEMSMPVLILDPAGQIAFANASAGRLFGHADVKGASLNELLARAGVHADTDLLAVSAPRSIPELHLSDGRIVSLAADVLSDGCTLITFDDVSSRVRNAELARRDGLTGLANRDTLAVGLADTLQRGDEAVAVLCIDLDRFKAVNDSLGHPIGDALLRRVAERLCDAAGEDALVARMGGDEFAIVQRGGTQPEAAEALAARLVDLIGRTYVLEGHMINVGASVGVAVAPSDGSTAAILLKNADLALYRAKFDGRGTFRFFEREMDVRMQARRAMEIDLRRALAMRQFHLLYQPQVELAGNRIVGFEALLRWTHETRGLVPPAEFIPLAEEIGVIGTIGEWVLRTACVEAATWPEGVSVAVNLSPVQFHSGKLVETVASALAHSGLAPDRLELEITEGALLNDTEAVLVALNRLRAIGVRISMDDFGTGYSSLSYLQKFPFDKIKIDQSFIRGMGDNPECGAIVRAVAGLGASLGMKTTAEGVETAEQLAAIRAEGCCEVQGYLTGRPISATDAASLLAAQPTHSAS